MVTPLIGTEFAANSLQRVRYTHDAMVELIMGRPGIALDEIAKYFGYTKPWVSRVINSDAFQARLAERKTELFDPLLVQAFEDRMKGAASTSLQIVQEELDNALMLPTGNQLRRQFGMEALELTTKALGMGARDRASGPVVNATFVVALPPKAENEREWVQTAAGRRVIPEAVEVVAKEVSNG